MKGTSEKSAQDLLDNASENQSQKIELTEAAVQKIKSLIEEEQDKELKLRIFITGGGCSGYQYNFAFDREIEEGDILYEMGGVSLVIDPQSHLYLRGAQIDYEENLEGARFVIHNPNAGSTCSCGSSFSANCTP
ncbi:iron-sulfur cluster insertion protein ErpA [Methylacidiphilum kamchatkense]|uniref:Iron-sulfur cluster insertion apoprotein ErpA n=1 Tax=Methylacidiphilum kamchatkense Kam1 TaxID=1202785 RepID=A0A516TKK5_9BACT|nr:iron-sulfur cluster insertion protein ErpA [Methylacidiphilum kamchatkense]QDQ41704.1 iron-sulfur cluster insertion apoprotein ErpA [Methylacidiphilum kamchatkense Kam1]